ncbi:MAG: ATP-binding protein [Lachnospiraceae bacterium]
MDPILIEQVLINLLENAIRHSGDTKHICLTVSVEALTEQGKEPKDSEQTVRYAVFSVADQGRGLSSEVLGM